MHGARLGRRIEEPQHGGRPVPHRSAHRVYNGITGEYMLEIEGLCALGNDDPRGELTVICKTGPDQYKKHFLGLSDNVTYFVQQLEGYNVSPNRYKVIFKPSTILPDIDLG